MKRRTFIKKTAAATAGLSLSPLITACTSRKIDYLFINGAVIDGSGRPPVMLDVAIKNDKIIGIGKFGTSDAARVLDISGRVIAPGFIDIHTHTDIKLFANPRAESKIMQGVTTEVGGMDGDSVAPLTDEMRERWNKNIKPEEGFTVSWKSFPEYFEALKKNGHAVNFSSYVGQGTLRDSVIGNSDRPASNEDIKKMQYLLEQAMADGAWGISSGLEYTPGSFATTEEITKVASVLGGTAFPYTTHRRNEGDRLIEAVTEAIAIATGAGIPLNISHLKVEGRRNWHKTDELFALIEKAQKEGLRLTFDRYPYVAYNTGLANLFPTWAREGGTDKFLSRLKDAGELKKIEKYTRDKIDMLGSWDAVLVSSIHSKENAHLQGKRLPEIAAAWNIDPFEAARKLIIDERSRVGMVGFGMNEANTERILAHPDSVIASDGSARTVNGAWSSGSPHPRNYGTFPRAIAHYVRERHIVSLHEMIRKMTSLPAAIVGFRKRGKIEKNFFADLVVFNAETIQDNATFENPKQYCSGIDHVFVNGKPVLRDGQFTGELPGKILKS